MIWKNYFLNIRTGQDYFCIILLPTAELPIKSDKCPNSSISSFLRSFAEAAPEQDFIGVEVHQPGVGALLKEIEDRGLENVRIYSIDANDVIDLCLPDACLDRVMVFFPDPWHKKKHHKRRLIQHEFVQRVRHKLRVGGILHLATDWENYAEHMLEVMSESEGFANTQETGGYSPRPDDRPITKFEKRGETLGHGVWDLLFYRTN